MEEQLSLIIKLQEMDLRIRSLNDTKKRYPEVLAFLEQRRSENKQTLDKSKDALLAAQKKKRDRDKDLEAGIQKVEKLKARTSEIKTNKEYQALLKEIETAEQENKAIEDDILTFMEKIESAASSIKTAETKALEEDAAITEEQKEQEAAFAKADEELKAALQQRENAASRVARPLLGLYQKLLETKGGMAVAEARNEACSGCYMSIPPQVFVNVKKNESVITCPHCSRILFYKG